MTRGPDPGVCHVTSSLRAQLRLDAAAGADGAGDAGRRQGSASLRRDAGDGLCDGEARLRPREDEPAGATHLSLVDVPGGERGRVPGRAARREGSGSAREYSLSVVSQVYRISFLWMLRRNDLLVVAGTRIQGASGVGERTLRNSLPPSPPILSF